jgi:hypothetical protein
MLDKTYQKTKRHGDALNCCKEILKQLNEEEKLAILFDMCDSMRACDLVCPFI